MFFSGEVILIETEFIKNLELPVLELGSITIENWWIW
jgi:hypothetical protein